MVHVGVDLHKHTSQIAVLGEDGELTRHRLVNDGERVKRFFAAFPPKTPVAIEASGTWWWLVDLLEGLGHQPVLSHPKQTKAIASARLKNDRVDADRLVRLLRGDLLPTVWIPPAAVREARELVRHRIQLAWVRGEIRNRVVALLARRNLQPTSGKSWFTARGDRELERLPACRDPKPGPRRFPSAAAPAGRPNPPARRGAHPAMGGRSARAAAVYDPRHRPLPRHRARPRARRHPPLCPRQAGSPATSA